MEIFVCVSDIRDEDSTAHTRHGYPQLIHAAMPNSEIVLSRDEFAIEDNGKRQDLTLFSSDLQPITVVMLLDRSGSMKPNFTLEREGAEAFVRSMGPADKARIGSFSKAIQVDPDDFTSD